YGSIGPAPTGDASPSPSSAGKPRATESPGPGDLSPWRARSGRNGRGGATATDDRRTRGARQDRDDAQEQARWFRDDGHPVEFREDRREGLVRWVPVELARGLDEVRDRCCCWQGEIGGRIAPPVGRIEYLQIKGRRRARPRHAVPLLVRRVALHVEGRSG